MMRKETGDTKRMNKIAPPPLFRRLLSPCAPRLADPRQREAFREHLLSSAWGGVSNGVIILTDVILAKALGAPGWQITLFATLGPAANLFSFYWAGAVQGRRKAGAFLLAALMGRLPLAALVLWTASPALILLSFLHSVATALLITAANALYQTRYPEESRPLCFGIATSVGTAAAIATTLGSGLILQTREQSYPWLFALAGLAGFVSAYHLYRMEADRNERRDMLGWLRIGWAALRRTLSPESPARESRPTLMESLRLASRTFRENPEFVRFERNFMLYGFAFLSLIPVLPIYIVRELSMDYNQLSASKGLWSQIGLVALSPILGIWLGKLRPIRFTGRIFLLLALYPLCLWISTIPLIHGRVDWVYAGLLFYSVAMAGVNLSWTLGSMHFAGEEEASMFQGMHVALTGVRGLLAPTLGYGIQRVFGSAAAFLFSTALFALAGLLMLKQDRDLRNGRASGT